MKDKEVVLFQSRTGEHDRVETATLYSAGVTDPEGVQTMLHGHDLPEFQDVVTKVTIKPNWKGFPSLQFSGRECAATLADITRFPSGLEPSRNVSQAENSAH